jgi:hypothetical protein
VTENNTVCSVGAVMENEIKGLDELANQLALKAKALDTESLKRNGYPADLADFKEKFEQILRNYVFAK